MTYPVGIMLLPMNKFPSPEEILPESFLSKYRRKNPKWGFNGLGGIIFYRTYAREKPDGSLERWDEVVERCVRGAQKIGAGYSLQEAEDLYDLVFNLKCNFAGRMLWQLGTSTVERFGLPSLCNCWFITMHEPESFCFLFEHLMLGGGVGFSVKREHIHELPKIQKDFRIEHLPTKDADFIVSDKREGWVELLRKVCDSAFNTGKSFTYSTILVRGANEKIKGFGGTASGPQILIDGMEKILKIFASREGKKLRSIDVLDICNIIGSIVVAGNVRRSAEIAIGDADDTLFLKAKRWDLMTIPAWRSMSNNTIDADDYSYLSNDFWSGYNGDGEAYGLFNKDLCRKFGRLIDGPSPKEDKIEGVNPCAEANLEHGEPCDLAELYIHNLSSKEEAAKAAILLYKTQKAVLTLPSISKYTEKVVKKNMRIGLGVTGICEDLEKMKWLDYVYKELKAFDAEWSKQRGWNTSVKLTVVKPSGTLSLLAGCSPGGHPAYSKYFIRRVRMASHDKLVGICKNLGYHVEYVKNFDGSEKHDTVVIEFPCESATTAVTAKDLSAVQQLEIMKELQTYWADQSVSITVYYKKEELPAIKEWLKENYKTSVKSVSFLLHSDHGFLQAPYEEIDVERYTKIKSQVKSLIDISLVGSGEIESQECVNGACPIK